jgi:ATP-dependent DNA helicase RecG
MNIMTKTNDGFKIAEKDLEIRGPGEFLGVRQHGLPEFKIANIFADNLVLEETSKVAKDIFSNRRDDINYKSLFDKVNSKFSEITL